MRRPGPTLRHLLAAAVFIPAAACLVWLDDTALAVFLLIMAVIASRLLILGPGESDSRSG